MLDGIMGTIDQQVDDKKDLLRANPNMKGTVGKDLIGVMALQKMQKEKQAAENELMLAQQNNPSTIKEQLENEVAGLTQNEMALQTAGIMNQRQQQKQQQRPPQSTPMMGKNPSLAINRGAPQGGIANARAPMARAPMAGAPRPPMPQGAGIAGAPRPPMMAQGGIVGFNDGGTTDSKRSFKQSPEMAERQAEHRRKQEFRRQIQKLFADGQIGPQRKQELLQQVDAGTYKPATQEQKAAGLNLLGGKPPSNQPLLGLGGNPYPKQQVEQPPGTKTDELSDEELNKQIDTDYARQYVRNQYNKDAASDDTTTTGPKVGDKVDLANTDAGGKFKGMLEEKMSTGLTAAQDAKAQAQGNEVMGRLPDGMQDTLTSMSKTQEQMQQARDTETASARADYDRNYNAQGLMAKRQAADEELRRQLTPEALREQRLRAGAVQRGGLAGARARADNRADERRYKLYNDSADNYASDMKADVEKVKAIDTRVGAYMDRLYADRVASMSVFGDLVVAEQEAVTAARDRFQKENEAVLDSLISVLGYDSQERIAEAVRAEASIPALLTIGERLVNNKEEAIKDYINSYEYTQAPEESEVDPVTNQVLVKSKAVLLAERRTSLDKKFDALERLISQQVERLTRTSLPSFAGTGGNDSEFEPQNDQELTDIYGTR